MIGQQSNWNCVCIWHKMGTTHELPVFPAVWQIKQNVMEWDYFWPQIYGTNGTQSLIFIYLVKNINLEFSLRIWACLFSSFREFQTYCTLIKISIFLLIFCLYSNVSLIYSFLVTFDKCVKSKEEITKCWDISTRLHNVKQMSK